MADKTPIPEEEILEKYKNVWWTISKLAKKYKTTQYRIRKLLTDRGVMREFTGVEQVMIKNLLKYERQFDSRQRTSVEMYIARKLLQAYPKDEFWRSFELSFKLHSLAWLQSDAGQAILNKKYAEFGFELPVNSTHNIGTEKVGEDAEVVSKPKSIHEFLRR